MGFFTSSSPSSSHDAFIPIETPQRPKRRSLWKRLTHKFPCADDEDLDNALYTTDDVEIRYDEEGKAYRRMCDRHGCLIHYYYPDIPPLLPQLTARSHRSTSQHPRALNPQHTTRSAASSHHHMTQAPPEQQPGLQIADTLGTPLPAQTNPWAVSPEFGGTVLDEIQLCYLSSSIQFHPLLSYVKGGRIALVFDVRRPISDVYAQGDAEGSVSLEEPATAPRISCLKLVFQYASDVLTLHNPKGVTIGQVIRSILALAKTNFTQEAFSALDDETKRSCTFSYQRNLPLHHAFSEVEMKVYDTFLDLVYFAGLMVDDQITEKRVGWRDPAVFTACLADAGTVVGSGGG
ncbi:hypothetical protein FRB98_005147 [Tulasnella sp. 332]|nr:hypothetical protein FRB98_005147 [Tulasnella sp. 332]